MAATQHSWVTLAVSHRDTANREVTCAPVAMTSGPRPVSVTSKYVHTGSDTAASACANCCSKEPQRGMMWPAQLWRTLDAHGFGGRFLVFPHHLSATHTHAHIRIHRYALTRWALLRRRGGVGAAAVVAAGIASWV